MELAQLLPAARAAGAIDLALGVPSGDPPPSAVRAAVAGLSRGANQYADPAGVHELRAFVAEYLTRVRGAPVDPATELTITSGATEGVLVALLATTDPGDEVLLPDPCFENQPGTVALTGAAPVPVPLCGPGFRLDAARLRSAITPRTRAVLLTNPHNPTGRVFDEEELVGVAELCVEFDLVLIVDEVYDRFVFDGRGHLSPLGTGRLAAIRDRAIVVGSLSKSLRMSGWRLGFCVAAPELTGALRGVHERTTLGTGHPLQRGGAAVDLSEVDFAAAALEVARRRDLVCDRLCALGFTLTRPEGGWFVLANAAAFGRPADVLARELVEQAGVLVAPGTPFFADRARGQDWIRVALVREHAEIEEALDRMAAHLGVPAQAGV